MWEPKVARDQHEYALIIENYQKTKKKKNIISNTNTMTKYRASLELTAYVTLLTTITVIILVDSLLCKEN